MCPDMDTLRQSLLGIPRACQISVCKFEVPCPVLSEDVPMDMFQDGGGLKGFGLSMRKFAIEWRKVPSMWIGDGMVEDRIHFRVHMGQSIHPTRTGAGCDKRVGNAEEFDLLGATSHLAVDLGGRRHC